MWRRGRRGGGGSSGRSRGVGGGGGGDFRELLQARTSAFELDWSYERCRPNLESLAMEVLDLKRGFWLLQSGC